MRGLIYGGIGFAAGLAIVFVFEARPAERGEYGLDQRLAQERARTLELEAELERLRAAATAPPAAAEPPVVKPKAGEYWSTDGVAPAEIPASVKEAAAAMGVPDDALRAAFDACRGFPSTENLDRLARHGIDGFRALVALLRGGVQGRFDIQFQRAWTPAAAGQERALIETAESEAVHVWSRWAALSALGVTDSAAAREYVVARLRRETDPGLFMCAARAAGELCEDRALPDLLRGMRTKRWTTQVRQEVFCAAVRAAGERARDILVDYLREPDADLLGTALYFLSGIDVEAARAEAEDLLAGPRAATLTGDQLRDLREAAGRR